MAGIGPWGSYSRFLHSSRGVDIIQKIIYFKRVKSLFVLYLKGVADQMKRSHVMLFFLSALLYSFATMGFQCASPELTSARLYIQRQEWENAIKSLEKEVQKNPQDEEAWYLMGRVKGEIKDFQGMNDAFAKALAISQQHKKDIQDARLHFWAQYFNQGVLNFQKGKDSTEYYDKAVAAFQTAAIILPDSVNTYKNLAIAYLAKGDDTDAIKTMEKALSMQEDPLIARLLGEEYFNIGKKHKDSFEEKNRDALEVIRAVDAIHKGMHREDVEKTLGSPDSKEQGKGKKSQEEVWMYEKYGLKLTFVDRLLAQKTVTKPFEASIDSTDYRIAMDYFNKSIDVLTVAQRMDPTNEDILTLLSNAYIAAGKAAVAEETFLKGIETNPGNKFFHYNLGVLRLKAEKYEDAVKQFSDALKIDPNYENALYNLVVAYVNWGVAMREKAQRGVEGTNKPIDESYKEKFQEALPLLERLLSMRPKDADLWELAGRLYANMNMPEKSKQAFEKSDQLRKGE